MSDIPTDPLSAPYHGLFGCGLCEWRDGCARLFAEAVPRHQNRAGVMHGGVGRGLIDQAAASFGLWCCVPGDARRGMTRTRATQFGAPVITGPVVAEGAESGAAGRRSAPARRCSAPTGHWSPWASARIARGAAAGRQSKECRSQ
jgi:acyl-coenzyme A thioesterase PaaI-like protein